MASRWFTHLLDRWHGNTADGEAHEVVAIAEGAPRHARDARLAEEREDILSRPELAPIIDGAAIVEVNAREEMILLVEMPQLAREPPATEAIERANPLLDLGML